MSSVHIDENVKGGLHWPLGSTCSASGRFKIVGSWHKKQTNVIGAGLKWYLQEVNRVEFKFSSGRSSYEVAVKPLNFRECFKVRKFYLFSFEKEMMILNTMLNAKSFYFV